ncbi:MAG: hypothetical protein NT118_07805 [Lentisphaerae bacterium]|nr:hypothetical protein [Lentisphaerota bacterium]
MKFPIFPLGLALLAVALSGCTSFDRVAAEKRLAAENPEIVQPTDSSLAKPFKLGILLDLETADSSGEYRRDWSWDDYEKKMVSSYADSLVKEGGVSEYFFIPEQDMPLQDLNAVMKKAAENKTDALLTIRGVINVNKYMNFFGILDFTIIGALVLPGSNMDVALLAHLDLWDLKNQKPLISLKSDGIQKDFGTTLFIRTNFANTENAVGNVKVDTLRKLLIDFKKKITEIRFQAAPPPSPKSEQLPGLPEGK